MMDEPTTAALQAKLESLLGLPLHEQTAHVESLCQSHASRREEILGWWVGLRALAQAASPRATPADAPSQVGLYRVLGMLGEGGMGSVYVAEQKEPVQRRVALKVIKLGMDTRSVLGRFESERQALAMMNHPNIARVLDAGATDRGQPYFVMELVRGIPITLYCDRNRLTVRERLMLFQQVCFGVQHAHLKGVMHRDLKPSNILVEQQDGKPVAKIIDFGLARATGGRLSEHTVFTEIGQILGTPEYMSPEQAEMAASDIDTRTDVYSLGVLLYQLLTGELPFHADEMRKGDQAEIKRRIREITPQRPSTRITSLDPKSSERALARGTDPGSLVRRLRGDLDWVTMKALEKDRSRRYQTPAELAADIERHLNSEPVLAGAPSVRYRVTKFVARYRVQVLAAGAVVLALVAGLVVSVAAWRRAFAAERRVTAQRDGFLRLAALAQLDSLKERADKLWPEASQQAGEMATWIADADTLIRSLEADQRLADALRGDRLGATDQRPAEAREEHTDRVLGIALARMVRELEPLRQLRDDVRHRLDWAAAVRQRTIVDHHAAWASAIAAIGSSQQYGGLALAPQEGLIPLGASPQGYFEFVHLRSGTIPVRGADGELAITDDTGIVFVLVPSGTVHLGAQNTDKSQIHFDALVEANETPVQAVKLAAFFIAKYEMTQAQWHALTGERPSRRPQDRHPVERVSWHTCRDLFVRHRLALPSEAQWEFAARAGTDLPWCHDTEDGIRSQGSINVADQQALQAKAPWGDPSMLDGFAFHAPVDRFAANRFGLHNVLGNVWELCLDAYGKYGEGKFRPGDGEQVREAAGTAASVVRGGSFKQELRQTRVSRRLELPRDAAYEDVGVRPARPIYPD